MRQQELEILEVVEVVQPTPADLAVEKLNRAVLVYRIEDMPDISA